MPFANIVRNNSVISTTFFSSRMSQSTVRFQGEGTLTLLFDKERALEFINTWASKVPKKKLKTIIKILKKTKMGTQHIKIYGM